LHGPRPSPTAAERSGRPRFEVADVFRAHGEAYRQRHSLSGDQLKVMRAIEACRTEALGGHLDVCPECDYSRPAYNSCRNRHCPKCQSLVGARWVEQRLARLLPTHYFHVVFTLPAELRPVAFQNQELIYGLLFAAASKTLLVLGGDPARLGGQLGFTAVLHTWTRELTFHPHLHCIVTGGGLTPGADRWVSARREYLFPVKVLGQLFRGKFLDGLAHAYADGKLKFAGSCAGLADPDAFGKLKDKLYRTNWVVYAKRPFAGPEQVFRYLSRYTHRVGISNQRIQAIDADGVRFATKGGKSVTVPPETFIGRFLLHVLPSGFVKIRHFGLHASSNATTKLVVARHILEAASDSPPVPPLSQAPETPTWQDRLIALTGVDPSVCPVCATPLLHLPLPRPTALAPAPLDTS
jgi:hypothetical protein